MQNLSAVFHREWAEGAITPAASWAPPRPPKSISMRRAEESAF